MSLKLYKMDLSPPACAAMMICEIHDVPVEMIELNLMEKQHLTTEYLKKNPMHTVPMLEDGDLYIHDSHVILTYLTDKYGKDDSLYPKDLKKRALVDQKIYFDVWFFLRVRNISYPAIFEGVRQPPEKVLNAVREAYDFLETFLNKTEFVAADHMTVADVSLASTVSASRYVIPIDDKKYPKMQAWFSYMEKQPFYQKRTAAGSAKLKEILLQHLDM
ncbi:glutathione S-transferase 1-like [Maniola hyperantus]|uniref:glutathione S-transferase 1-like n=1 Tax=Aphantopus hyperantus TaxID=2795564 RepID=UPI0015690D52|nr:glutathione S-transferase 1-like [Maniola hyperantus]XP_034824492.1 glutathione S-transferase 1-like [Maniola hyperantus]